MRKLVICLLVFGLYAIQTVVGHMNSDPAPGRSPGPPADFYLNPKQINDDNNTTNSSHDNNAKVLANNNDAIKINDNTTVTTSKNNQQPEQQISRNHTNSSQQQQSNNASDKNYSDRESLNDSQNHLIASTKLNNHNEANDDDDDDDDDKDDDNVADVDVIYDDTQRHQLNTNARIADDKINFFSFATSTSSHSDDAINFQLTNENNYNSPSNKNQQNVNAETANNYPANEAAGSIAFHGEHEQMTGHESIDSPSSTHEKIRQHTKTIPATHNNNGNMETTSTELFSSLPVVTDSASSIPAASSASTSESSHHSSSCQSDLNDFLNDVAVIEVDDNNTDSFLNATNSSTTSLPPLLQGFKIQLQLYHDVFDASTAFGINCGLTYRVRLTTSLPTLKKPSATFSSTTTSASASTASRNAAVAQEEQILMTEMHNPTIRQYTGDFFVETVSLISSKERGTFITNSADAGGSSDRSTSDEKSEALGNKLPISRFATSQQHTGNRQIKHNNNNAAALTKDSFHSNLSSRFDEEKVSDQVGAARNLKASLEGGENVGNLSPNSFYKATKNGFKTKQRQQHEANNGNSNGNNNKWHNRDNAASFPATSSSSSSSANKKRRKSPELVESTTDICSSENTWQGRTKSNTNAAGGISTESVGLWLVNELCEQDDTIEFRVFFRLKPKLSNIRSSSNNSNSSINNNNNVWLNADSHMDHAASASNVDEAQIFVYRKTFKFQIRKDCHLILRETSMGTLDYTVLPLYCIDCTVHFPSYKHLNDESSDGAAQQDPPGMLLELQRLNVPCSSGGYIRFRGHKMLCGKLEELEPTDRIYHFNIEDEEASVQFYRNPMFSLSYKLVDYCYNVSSGNESGEFFVRSSMKDMLECYFRIHLPYGNRVLLRMVANNDSDILPMPTLMSEGGDVVHEEELYTIFTSQGTTIDAQVINLTINGGNSFGILPSFSSSLLPYFKLPDVNNTNNRKLAGDLRHKSFASLGLDSFGFLAATKANMQMAFSGTANCMGVVIKVFENDHSKWSHCVNNTKQMRGFILESSSNTLSVHLFHARTTAKETGREAKKFSTNKPLNRHQMPAIYLSYQARPLPDIVSNCAFGWIAVEQFCIAAIEMSLSWHESEVYCSKLGGHLVSIRNEEQQRLISELLLRSPGYTDHNAYWVGGSDKSYEGDFRWSDGLVFQYTNWFPGWSQHGHYNKQPNDDGLSSQDCIELRRYFRTPPGVQSNRSPLTNKYMWNDRDCSANNFLICERAMSDDSLRRNWLNDCNKTVSLTKEHPRASIWSPSFPRQYPDNVNCFTTITAPAGYRIVIEFEELVIENEQGCTYDYLEITEPKMSESLKSSSSNNRYGPNSPNSFTQTTPNLNLKFNYNNNPNVKSYQKRSSYDTDSVLADDAAEHVYAPQNTDYNGYDLAQNNYQKLLEIYSSLYSPRNNFIIQTPDYPKGNPHFHHTAPSSTSHNHHSAYNNNRGGGQEVLPKRLCGDWSTKLKLLRYVSAGSFLGLHFVSDYSHHFGGYKAKTYMENTASECSNERLKPYNGSCYLFVSYPEVDWWTAQQVCRGMGAKLTSVSSADEHRFITSNIRNQIDYSPQLIYWLGAELEKNGQFEWTDDSKMSFQGWLPGQGQFDILPSDAICLGLQWKMSPTPMLPSGLYWQSQKCNKIGGYVCKKPKESFGNFAFSNFTVTGTEGRLVSPAYPNNYPLNIDYWIHIKAAERTRIIVQFQKIDLEPQDECLYDFISVQDYDIVSKIILEPGTNTVPMTMLMSDEQFTSYENDNNDNNSDADGDGDGDDGGGVDENSENNNNDSGNDGDDDDADEDAEDSSNDVEADANNNDNNVANDKETTYSYKKAKQNSNTRLQLQQLQEEQQQAYNRIRRSLSATYKSIRRRQKLIKRQTQLINKSQNRKRRRKKNFTTAKLQRRKQHRNARNDTQNFHNLLTETSTRTIHHNYKTMDHELNLQQQRKPKRTRWLDSGNKIKQQRQIQSNVNMRSINCVYENPKRCRRKKLSMDIENRKSKPFAKPSTPSARYRRSTILNDDSSPSYDNAQSFLPYVRWCGSHESNMSKFDFVSRSNEVMLNFRSDYSITGLGFAAVWKAIDVSGCPLRTLTSREGTVSSPNYPHFLLNNLNCVYVVQAPVGKRVWLEFIEYDFQADALLEVDIGNGLIRPFRRSDHLNDGMFVSLKEQLRVQFRTGQHPRGKGFQAVYHTVGQMERRERTISLTSNDTGYLYQLNYPHDMPENVDFTQHLVAPFGHNILLELHGVEFTENGCQDNNILEISDNYADNNGTKWQLCKFEYANFHASSSRDDNYFSNNMYGQHPSESNDRIDKAKKPTTTAIGNMATSASTVAQFLLRQHKQLMPVPPPPPPVYITSYLNTLYIRQRTTAKSIANLNCTIRLQWDNNYKMKLASGDKSVESCQPNPCQYNGKCVVNNGTSYCQCLGHFTGRFCGLNLCELEPCVFGRCELTTNNFKCQCHPGYMGTTCEQKQRPCADNPCEGRGICVERNGGFFCREKYYCESTMNNYFSYQFLHETIQGEFFPDRKYMERGQISRELVFMMGVHNCYAWWEGQRCEKRMLHIPYKPLSERMLQEPFWLGLITVFVVLAVIGLVWCAKRHFPEKIEKLLAEEADRNRPPGSIHGHHHHTSLREQLQFTTAIPQTTVNNAPGAPRSIFNRLGIRKPSLLSLSSPNPIPGGGGAAARTFSLDDLLRPPPRRSPSPRKKRNNSTPVKKNAAEKKQILQQLVSPAAQPAKPKVSLGELISMSENRLRANNVDSESDLKETTFSENTGSLTSGTVERAINDPKLEKKVTFARLLNKVSAEMSSGSEATRNSSALSLPTDIQMRASSMPPSPCTNDIRSPHSASSTHGSESFSSSDLALTDFGLRSIQTSGSEMGSTNNHQLSGLPMRCRIGSPARPKVSSADSILAMFRNFANSAGNASNTTTNTMPSTTSVFVSPSTTPTVSSPQDDAPGDDESSSSSMHTPVSFSSGAPDSPVFYRQTTTIEVPVLDVLNAHKSTANSSSSSSSSSNLLHPPTILLEIPTINNKCLSPIREMPTPIPSPALTPIMPRSQRSNSPIFQEDPSSGADFSDDDDKSDHSDTQLSEKLRFGLQREKSRLVDSDVETTPTDTTTTSMANSNKRVGGINYKIPKLSFTPAIAAATMHTPAITIDIEPPTPDEKQARPRDLIIPTLTVEQPSPTKNRHPMIIFPGSPPPQRASIGETSFMFPNKQQQKRLLKQFEKPTSLDFPFAPPTITVTSNMSELESDTEPLSPAQKTVGSGGLMPPNPVGMCYLSPFTMCTRADRTISESNLSSSGYSSMASPGPSRCGSSNPLYPNEMDEPGSGHSGPGLSLHVNLMNRRKSSVLPSCKENITNGKCTAPTTGGNTDRLQSHRPRSDSETFSDDILIESNDEGIGTDHIDEKLDETRLSSRRFDMFLDDEILIEVDEPPAASLQTNSMSPPVSTNLLSINSGPQMAQLQLPSIVIQIDGSGDKTLSPVSSRSESPLSERAGMGRFSPHFYGRKDQLPFTDSDGLYDFPSSDGKGTSMHTFSHQRRSSSKKRERKSSKCSSTQSPTKQQLDMPSKESLNTSSTTPSSITHICNKHCHSHHHPCPAITVTTRKSPKRRLLNRHPIASSSSSSESLNSTKELTVRPLPRRLNSPNREKRPRKQESLSEDEVADSILRRISPSIVKEDESVRPKCKINRLRAIGNQIRFLRRLEKSIKTRERIVSPSDSCPEENTDDMDSPQASSPLLQPTSPNKTRLALCRQKRLPSGTYGITAAALNSSNWKGMDRSLIGDDLNSD